MTLVLDREGAGGRGRRGRKTCPISAPLPDLMLALPFSSPCSLQAPCFSVTAVRSTVLVLALLQGTREGSPQESRAAEGCLPCLRHFLYWGRD